MPSLHIFSFMFNSNEMYFSDVVQIDCWIGTKWNDHDNVPANVQGRKWMSTWVSCRLWWIYNHISPIYDITIFHIYGVYYLLYWHNSGWPSDLKRDEIVIMGIRSRWNSCIWISNHTSWIHLNKEECNLISWCILDRINILDGYWKWHDIDNDLISIIPKVL